MKITQITRKSGAFQQAVNETALSQALSQQLRDEKLLEVTELAEGLFNNTFKVVTANNQYILKVAPPGDANLLYHERFLMQREKSIARQLESVSPLIPKYLAFFKVGQRDAFLQSYIEGKLWHSELAVLSEKENTLLWQQLGRFAQLLHQHSGDSFGFPAPFNAFQYWSDFILNKVEGLLADCQRYQINSPEITEYRRLLPQFLTSLDKVTTPRLLHGDLWPRNVIFAGKGDDILIKAVIDAERAFWGDPVSDWVLILYGVPQAFWQGYGVNLVENSDPARVAIYKGMYFIVNILEAAREQRPQDPAMQHLALINKELAGLL